MAKPDVLIASNRGPYVYERSEGGFDARRGGGGLIGSLAPVLDSTGGSWVAAALGDGDREFARAHPDGRDEGGFHLRLLDIDPEVHRLHYEVISNEVLWFLFHYLFDVPSLPAFDAGFFRAWGAYRRVNELYAEAVAEMRSGAVLFEDYHLLLAGKMLRERWRRRAPLLYFHHTPWCEPSYFALLPDSVRDEILTAMLAYDVVGFHSRRWAEAFMSCCERLVPGVRRDGDTLTRARRTTNVIVAPAPIEVDGLRAEAADERTDRWVERHGEMLEGRKLLLRVDRIDLSKNPLRGFLAFERLLERDPAMCDEVVFLALLYPSRSSVERYQHYYAECMGVVRRVNERFERRTNADTGPIHLSFEDDFHRSLGAMRLSDVLLVNPIFDGLNLVAKEGPTINERDGTLVLSRNAGVFEEIGDAVIPVNPFDVEETADAMARALSAPSRERAKRASRLRRLASATTPAEWLATQLAAAGA